MSHFNRPADFGYPRKSKSVDASECAIIGDRILTDVVFGNLHGMMTIHVEPLTLVGDNSMAKLSRWAERKLFPFDSP